MPTKIEDLRKAIRAAEENLKNYKARLDTLERECPHQWGEVIYDPIKYPGYHSPGDPPGTMGVDRRLPSYVEPSTTPRWTRTCEVCGKVEITTRTQEEVKVKKTPVF